MDWSRVTLKKIRGLIVFTIAILVGLWRIDIVLGAFGFVWGILFPFALGGAIAFVINVPMCFLEKKLFGEEREKRGRVAKKLARPTSLILTVAAVIGIVVLVMFVLAPQLGETVMSLGKNIAAFLPEFRRWVEELTNENAEVMKWVNKIEFDPDAILQWGISAFGVGAGNMVSTTMAAVGGIISSVTTFFIAFSFACYILVQKEKLQIQVRKVIYAFIPRGKAEVVLEICSLTYKTFANFLAGQCVEAAILGGMFVVSMTALKMPYALLVGIIIAFTALVPVFGGFIGSTVGFFLIFMVNPKQALLFVGLFLLLQEIEGNLIYPRVVGNSVGLPSIWVLAAVSIGGNLMGIIGMLIFIPIASVAYALFREIVYLKLKKNKIKEVTAKCVEEYTPQEVERMQKAYEAEHPEQGSGE